MYIGQLMQCWANSSGFEGIDVPHSVRIGSEQLHPAVVDASLSGTLGFWTVCPGQRSGVDLKPDPLFVKCLEPAQFLVPVWIAFDMGQHGLESFDLGLEDESLE